eukprot:7801879-Pyramimonas_sp.AAC.1
MVLLARLRQGKHVTRCWQAAARQHRYLWAGCGQHRYLWAGCGTTNTLPCAWGLGIPLRPPQRLTPRLLQWCSDIITHSAT